MCSSAVFAGYQSLQLSRRNVVSRQCFYGRMLPGMRSLPRYITVTILLKSSSFYLHFLILTGPGDQCEGSSQESFDMATYYTSKTYITTGQQQPIIESQLCAPGMICNSDGKCSTCTQYIHFHNFFICLSYFP